jgi:hypothetical protein
MVLGRSGISSGEEYMITWEELWSIQSKESKQTELIVRTCFMFEPAKMLKAYDRLIDRKTDISCYLAEMKMELSDSVTQLHFFCDLNSWSFQQLSLEYTYIVHPGNLESQLRKLIGLVADIQQKGLYTYLSGDKKHVEGIKPKVGQAIGYCEALCKTLSFSWTEVQDLGKSRVKNGKIQMLLKEEQQCLTH